MRRKSDFSVLHLLSRSAHFSAAHGNIERQAHMFIQNGGYIHLSISRLIIFLNVSFLALLLLQGTGIRDPRSGIRDQRSGIRDPDPRSGIRDLGWIKMDRGLEINIPDLQHCYR